MLLFTHSGYRGTLEDKSVKAYECKTCRKLFYLFSDVEAHKAKTGHMDVVEK